MTKDAYDGGSQILRAYHVDSTYIIEILSQSIGYIGCSKVEVNFSGATRTILPAIAQLQASRIPSVIV